MNKKPSALIENDTFTHAGMRYSVQGEVVNTGDRTTVYTNVTVLHIPNHVDLRIV